MASLDTLAMKGIKFISKKFKFTPVTYKHKNGAVYWKNHSTGTKGIRYENNKMIILGEGNRLSKIFKKGAIISVSPKNDTLCKNGKNINLVANLLGSKEKFIGNFSPEEFGKFVRTLLNPYEK